MTLDEAIDHLRARKSKLDDTYRDSFPRWSTTDLVAVSIVLGEMGNLRHKAETDDEEQKG